VRISDQLPLPTCQLSYQLLCRRIRQLQADLQDAKSSSRQDRAAAEQAQQSQRSAVCLAELLRLSCVIFTSGYAFCMAWQLQEKDLVDIKRQRNVLKKVLAEEENKIAVAVAQATAKVSPNCRPCPLPLRRAQAG
jgi:hypothetical protein